MLLLTPADASLQRVRHRWRKHASPRERDRERETQREREGVRGEREYFGRPNTLDSQETSNKMYAPGTGHILSRTCLTTNVVCAEDNVYICKC